MGAAASTLSKEEFDRAAELYEQLKMEAKLDFQHVKTKFIEQQQQQQQSRPSKMARSSTPPHDDPDHFLNHEWGVGDVVKVRDTTIPTLHFEGVITEACKLNAHQVKVDFGDSEEMVDLDRLVLVLRSHDVEVGDKVQFKASGMAIWFVGHIIRKNPDGTFDIHVDSSDDPDDIERGVHNDDVRKLMTGRNLAMLHFQNAVHAVKAINAFKSMGAFHSKAREKLDLIKGKKLVAGVTAAAAVVE